MNEIKQLRMNIMGGMNAYVLETVDDENTLEFWYTYGIPKDATEGMLAKWAENDEVWLEVVHAFADVLRMD